MTKKYTLLVDRKLQNTKGESIRDFKAYFNELLCKAGYVKAKQIIRQECHIFITIIEVKEG